MTTIIDEVRKQLNIDVRRGVLGDNTGTVRESGTGRYYVRIEKAPGVYYPPAPYYLMAGAVVDPQANIPVFVGYDRRTKRDAIIGMDNAALSNMGINPLRSNPNDPAAADLIPNERIAPLYSRPHPDASGLPFYAQVYPALLVDSDGVVSFSGDQINLASYAPSAGNHRYVMVFIQNDFETLEAAGSTEQSTSSALDDSDLTEAYENRTAGSIPVRAYKMADGDTSLNGNFSDSPFIRQLVNDKAKWAEQEPNTFLAGPIGTTFYAEPEFRSIAGEDIDGLQFGGTFLGNVGYTAAEPDNWHDPDPTTTAEGLDALAVRAVHVEDYGNGWPPDCSGDVALAFDDGTRTLTLTPDSSITYYIDGVPYVLSSADSVAIDDTEGLWYIYYSGDTLTASQTPWDLLADIVLVATVYWDATNNEAVHMAYELHSWLMDRATHRNIHLCVGTRYSSGLGCAINGDELDLSGGVIFDEDIKASIVDDDTPDTEWEQALTPLAAPKLYREGASGDWRLDSTTSTPVILDSNVPQYNWYTGGAWTLDDVSVNEYFVYWVIATTDPDYPVIMIPGQEVDNTLAQARAGNSISDMQFGDLPTAEFKVIWRVICHRIAASPYYALDELNDYRNVLSEPTSGFTGADHGSLGGLQDEEDHLYAFLHDGTRDMSGDLDMGAYDLENADRLEVNEVAAPGTPASGKVSIYAKTDGKLYIKDDAGTETDLTSGGSAIDVYENGVSVVTGIDKLDFKDFNVEDLGSDDAGIYHDIPGIFEARLTLATGTPVTTTDQTAKTEVFLTPYKGNRLSLYDGTRWKIQTLSSDISILITDDDQTGDTTNGSAVITDLQDTSQLIVGMECTGTGIAADSIISTIDSATQVTLDKNATADGGDVSLTFKVPANTNLDIFVDENSDSPKLYMVAWTNQTTRATALTTQNGIYVLTGATDNIYVGTIATTSTAGQVEDTAGNRIVWNYYNRVRRRLFAGTGSLQNFTVGSDVTVDMPNTTLGEGRIGMVVGVDEEPPRVQWTACGSSDTAGGITLPGIALDEAGTGVDVDDWVNDNGGYAISPSASMVMFFSVAYERHIGIGYHYLQRQVFKFSGKDTQIDDRSTRNFVGHIMG